MAAELKGGVESDRPDEDGFNQGDLAEVEKGELLAPLPSNNTTEHYSWSCLWDEIK